MPRRPPRLPPLLAEFDDEEREAVLTANRAFYRAFNDRDATAMDVLWAPTGSLVIWTSPGRARSSASLPVTLARSGAPGLPSR